MGGIRARARGITRRKTPRKNRTATANRTATHLGTIKEDNRSDQSVMRLISRVSRAACLELSGQKFDRLFVATSPRNKTHTYV